MKKTIREHLKYFIIIFFAAMFMANTTGSAFAGDDDRLIVTLKADYYSKYIWRGADLSVNPVFQPSINFQKKGLIFEIWGNMDIGNIGEYKGQFTEFDYTLKYDWSNCGTDYSAGVITYMIPRDHSSITSEAFLNLSWAGALEPALSLNYDFDKGHGLYTSFKVGHTFEDALNFASMNLSAAIGYGTNDINNFIFNINQSNFTDAKFSLDFPFNMREDWNITPSFNYSTILFDSKAREKRAADGHINDNFWFGISISKCL